LPARDGASIDSTGAWVMLKIAVFGADPKASESTATR